MNYQFGSDGSGANALMKAPPMPEPDTVNFHGQTTFLEQAYPAFRSPYQGPNSCPAAGKDARPGT